jgi:hypothetical protein
LGLPAVKAGIFFPPQNQLAGRNEKKCLAKLEDRAFVTMMKLRLRHFFAATPPSKTKLERVL